ncbi:MAG: RidA family protein [Deltaproteobacteria bacterium]|nr:RidA family protein [Deltaproteobacteria bacterium]
MSIEDRLGELGITLPPAPAPAANYVPFVQEGQLLFISGQIPFGPDGKLAYVGRLGRDYSVEEGYQSARLCVLNGLAQVRAALGSLDRVRRIVRVGGFVNCTEDFTQQPQVINGASDVLVEIFGDRGRHARAAVGSISLPLGVATEVELVVAFE